MTARQNCECSFDISRSTISLVRIKKLDYDMRRARDLMFEFAGVDNELIALACSAEARS